MKNISKSTKRVFAGVFIASSCLFIAQQAVAQDKPKGKPWPAPESAIKMKSDVKPDAEAIKAGKEIYAQQCKSCHGAKGQGDGQKAEKLDITCGDFTSDDFAKVSEGEAYWKTTEGRKPMPSFKEKLSDTERWQVVAYIRSLKAK